MRYIEENKVLEKDVAEVKDLVEHYKLQIMKYEAVKIRSDVDTKHWSKLLEEMVVQMKTHEEYLRASIVALDKRCAEAKDISKPGVVAAVKAIPEQAEKERREKAEKERRER